MLQNHTSYSRSEARANGRAWSRALSLALRQRTRRHSSAGPPTTSQVNSQPTTHENTRVQPQVSRRRDRHQQEQDHLLHKVGLGQSQILDRSNGTIERRTREAETRCILRKKKTSIETEYSISSQPLVVLQRPTAPRPPKVLCVYFWHDIKCLLYPQLRSLDDVERSMRIGCNGRE